MSNRKMNLESNGGVDLDRVLELDAEISTVLVSISMLSSSGEHLGAIEAEAHLMELEVELDRLIA